MDISALSYILVPVRDLNAVRAWYRDVLELPLASDHDGAVEFSVGTLTLAFYPGSDAVAAGETEGLYIAFEVGDLDSQVAELRARGVVFVGEIETREDCRSIDLLDPEGDRLGLRMFREQ